MTESTDIQMTATVISHFGNEILIHNQQNQRIRAKVKQGLPALVCGDKIVWYENELNEAIAIELLPRHGLLTRSTQHAAEKLIAANVDIAFIIMSHKPAFKTALLDRYIAACELAEIQVSIVFNKIDSINASELDEFKAILAPYQQIGYPLHYISVKKMSGIDSFKKTVHNKTGVLVGQSGVGKSSILRALFPEANPKIGEISTKTNKGKHTTTYSELYTLDANSFLIDSPGIREFGLNIDDPYSLASGFRDFQPYLGQCQFRDCKHTTEPKCAIKQAVKEQNITQQRWDSYKGILVTLLE